LHGVAPLVHVNLEIAAQAGLAVPPQALHRFKLAAASTAINKKRQADQLANALKLFNQHGVEVMLIKGGALDLQVYEQPWYTKSQDIDLVVKPTRSALLRDGKESLVRSLDGFAIEYDFFSHHDITMNGALPIDFHQIWQDARPIRFGEHTVSVMSAEDTLIALSVNSCRKRFFRLKAMCDLAETVAKTTRLDWAQMAERARAFQVNYIVYAALRATQHTLGCQLPSGTLRSLQVPRARAASIEFLIRRGTLSAYESLMQGSSVFNRSITWHLLLPYFTFNWPQIWRRLRFVWRTRSNAPGLPK
jgi:hypothetical protein